MEAANFLLGIFGVSKSKNINFVPLFLFDLIGVVLTTVLIFLLILLHKKISKFDIVVKPWPSGTLKWRVFCKNEELK